MTTSGPASAVPNPAADPAVASVARLWRYPVKSMRGEQVATAVVDKRGMIGDRLWAVWDADGHFGSGKRSRRFRRMDGLMDFQTRLTNDPDTPDQAVPELVTPDGARHPVPSAQADAAVRARLGREDVSITVEGEVMHHDACPLHLVSTATLGWYAATLAGLPADERRLRPNLVLDVPGAEAFVEDGWIGRRIRIGGESDGVVAEVLRRTIRCVMTNMEQEGMPRSGRPLKALAGRDLTIGVYAAVLTGGRVRAGDPVVFVD